MKRSKYIFLLLVFATGYGMGQPAFRYKRNIEGVREAGWYTLVLPTAIFQNLNGELSDFRLYALEGKDTVELPYLLDVRHDEVARKEVQLPVFNTSRMDGELFVSFSLTPSQKVNSLDLAFEELNYFAFVTLEGSDDKSQWFELVKNRRIVSIRNEKSHYALSAITFPLTDYRFLRARVRSDIPLTFRRASFHYNDFTPGVYQEIPLRWNVRHDKKSRESFVDIRLRDFEPVSSLSLKADSTRDYYRPFRLEYVRDSVQTDKGWLKYYSPMYAGYLTSFKPNGFDFDWRTTKELRLVIDNNDNQPLDVLDVAVRGPEVHVIAYLKTGNNFMLYGAGAVRAPLYDLAHFQNKISEAPLKAILSAEEKLIPDRPTAKPLFENKLWLWSIMIVMIGALGFFTMKMMRPGAVNRS